MSDDADLLRRYARNRNEEAIAELVRRHIDLIYSAALRQVGGDAHRAQDVAQTVFAAMARRAAVLAQHPNLLGWLYTSTHHAAAQMRRTERRRQEREAHAMQIMTHAEEPTVDWQQLSPLLDDAMQELGERDRQAVLLRYFSGQTFAEIGSRLGVTEEAARKRVARALDRLRLLLTSRGVSSTTAALGLILANQAVTAAPAIVSNAVVGAVVNTTAGVGGITAALLEFMAMTKTQLGIVGALAGLCALITVSQYRSVASRRSELANLQQENGRLASQLVAMEKQVVALRAADTRRSHLASAKLFAEETETQRMEQIRRTGALDQTYAGLFRRLKLAPVQLAQLKELLLERQSREADIRRALQEQGVAAEEVSHALFAKLKAVATDEVDGRIRALLGADGFSRFSAYASSEGKHQLYEELAVHLRDTDSPLTDEQVDRLVALTAAARVAQFPDRDAVSVEQYNLPIPDEVVQEASKFLSSRQLDVLRQLKAVREGMVQMIAMNRASVSGSRPIVGPPVDKRSSSQKTGEVMP
ncbi:MAG: sigma-70 family RNA polymerase sigma factor [Opitutae bacterium]|nr:sigma-70 family RNA polymerase sigma factor [Opitutae bacterium]